MMNRIIADSLKYQRYNEQLRRDATEQVDENHSLEDIVYIRNTPYVAFVLKMISDGYLSREDFPFLLKPPRSYDVDDSEPEETMDPELLTDFTPKRHRRLFLVIIGGLSYTELHHLRSIAKGMKQQLVIITSSLSNPQSFIQTLSEMED